MHGGIVGHLLCWQQAERDSSWWDWVSWAQTISTRHVIKVVCVQHVFGRAQAFEC